MVGRPPYIETYDASRSKGFTDIVVAELGGVQGWQESDMSF
jgi:hypothetical protein